MDETTRARGSTSAAEAILRTLAAYIEQLGRAPTDVAARALAAQAAEELGALAHAEEAAREVVAIDALSPALLADLDKRRAAGAAHGGVVGTRCGLAHLDEVVNGFSPGLLYLLAAAPGAGKTTLALQWAATMALGGDVALYLSLENDALDLARKTACRMGKVSYSAALKGKVERSRWEYALQQIGRLGGRLHLAAPRAALPDLDAMIAQVTQRAGRAPALVVVDYLQAWVKREGAAGGEVRERIDRFVPQLRALGERHGCAMLAISSQNRSGYSGGGMVALKESGDIEYGCDVLMTVARVDEKNAPPAADGSVRLKLIVDKNRQGLTGRPMLLRLHGDACLVEEEEGGV